MIRTQIQLSEQQAKALKKLAAKEGKPVAELIRASVDILLDSTGTATPDEVRQRAIAVAGKFKDAPQDLASEHDRYLREAYES